MNLKFLKRIYILALLFFGISQFVNAKQVYLSPSQGQYKFEYKQVGIKKPPLSPYSKSTYDYKEIQPEIVYNFSKVPKDEWNKYFTHQSKKIKKQWKKQSKSLKDNKYKTSYVRVLLFVNNKGEILFWQKKSSCIPKGDKEFVKAVEQTISSLSNLKSTPVNYNNDTIAYTVKFNSYLPKFRKKQNIDWNRYGVADLEISNRTSYVLLNEK